MSNSARDRASQIIGYIPTIRRISREATLIFFVFFTLLSLTVFWTELFVEHGMAGEPGAQVLGYAINGIAGLFCIWLVSAAASNIMEAMKR